MIHDHAVMIHYMKYDQPVRIQTCKFTALDTAVYNAINLYMCIYTCWSYFAQCNY